MEKTYPERGRCAGISSAGLHIIAMASMLIDHALKTVIANDSWIFVLGRLAFPLFAFMAAEGYFRTRNFRHYLLRMLVFALLSEIPYDLMKSGQLIDGYDQNVIWTFLIALLCMRLIDLARSQGKRWLSVLGAIGGCAAGMLLGTVLLVDYGGMGVLTVLVFFFLRKRTVLNALLQVVLLFVIHFCFLGGMGYGVTLYLLGNAVELPLQGFAVFALIPIWLYFGRQGHHSKPFQLLCYAFYPVHMLLLYLLSTCL